MRAFSFNPRTEGGSMHGIRVVEQLSDIKGFIRRWRVHFITSLDPQYLSDAWSVEHLFSSTKFA